MDWLFLVLFIVLFFPLLLIQFDRVHKAQKKMIALLQEMNQKLARPVEAKEEEKSPG